MTAQMDEPTVWMNRQQNSHEEKNRKLGKTEGWLSRGFGSGSVNFRQEKWISRLILESANRALPTHMTHENGFAGLFLTS